MDWTFVKTQLCVGNWKLFPAILKTILKNTNARNRPLKFKANAEGVAGLLALKPDAVVLEPTGIHYSWIWAHICQKEGITVFWVGHCEATHYRKENKLPDKNDQADALALASYAILHQGQDDFFLQFEAGEVKELRQYWLQLQSLNRMKSPVVNRIRQQLAHEFPEAALLDTQPGSDGMEPLWCWLANRERSNVRKNNYYDKLRSSSIAETYQVDISTFTRRLSSYLCDLREWEIEVESQMLEILASPQFLPYRQTMDKFGIPPRCQALLISQIFPITKFESLGRFKRRLGMGMNEQSSGDSQQMNTGNGSKLCRCQLYLWIYNAIAPVKSRPQNEIGDKLGDFYDTRKLKFQSNPELWQQNAILKEQEKALREFKRKLQETISLSDDTLKEIDGILNLFILDKITKSASSKKSKAEVKRGFGKLVINQTAAYGCRLLFPELKKAVGLTVTEKD